MALEMTNYKLVNGLTSETAYIKIDTISGDKSEITIDIKVYVSKKASEENVPFIEQKTYRFTPDVSENSLNYHKQGYVFLKTLPEYEPAVNIPVDGSTD